MNMKETGSMTDDAGVLCMVEERQHPTQENAMVVVGKRIDTDAVVRVAYLKPSYPGSRIRERAINQIWRDTLNNPKFQSFTKGKQ